MKRLFPFNAEQTINILSEFGPLVAMFVTNAIYSDTDPELWHGTVAIIVTTVPTVPVVGVKPVMVGTKGITCSVCAGLVTVPVVAVMTVVPGPTEVARPFAVMVATVGSALAHVTRLVRSLVELSASVAVATNAWVCPIAIVGFTGVTASAVTAWANAGCDAGNGNGNSPQLSGCMVRGSATENNAPWESRPRRERSPHG